MKPIFTYLCLFSVAAILLSNANGRAWKATGAGDEDTCGTCHAGGDFELEMVLEIVDENLQQITAYKPGKTYTMKVYNKTFKNSPKAFGFQATSLGLGAFSNPGNKMKINDFGGVEYPGHSSPNTTPEWTIDWTAPEAGTGDVVFYTSGNAVDLDGKSGGDDAAKTSLTITEDMNTNIADIDNPAVFSTYCFSNELNVQLQFDRLENYDVRIFSLAGNMLAQNDGQAYDSTLSFSTDNWTNGTYLVVLTVGNHQASRKVVIQQ